MDKESSPKNEAVPMSENYGKKSALLIGIDRYNSPWVPDLGGCVEDIRVMEAFLKNRVGISNITKLTSGSNIGADPPESGSLPTLNNVVKAFETLAREAQENGLVYVHYSGHGTRLPTGFPRLKNDNPDEALVLIREVDQRVDCLRDVELAFLLKKITDKGAFVTVTLDCCHSGGATRATVRIRGVDKIDMDAFPVRERIYLEEEVRAAWTNRKSGQLRAATVMSHWMTASRGVEYLAACRANQQAQETDRDEITRGLFTDCLISILEDNKHTLERLTCDMVYNLVSSQLAHRATGENPQNAVFGGKRNRPFFGVASVTQSAFTVTRAIPSNAHVLVQLDSGKAHGVLEGDEFAIYPSEKALTGLMDYNSPLAFLKVEKINDYASEGLTQAKEGFEKLIGCKAVQIREILKRHVLSPKSVKVLPARVQGQDEATLEAKEKIRTEGRLVRLQESNPSFFEVCDRGPGGFEISFTYDTKKGSGATVAAPSINQLLTRLTHLTIYCNLFNMGSEQCTPTLLAQKFGVLPSDFEPPAPHRNTAHHMPSMEGLRELVISDPQEIEHGDHIGIRLSNTGCRVLYIEVLILDPAWQVDRIYPKGEDTAISLLPNATVDFYVTMTMSETVPDSVPPDPFDSILILATTNERPNFPEDVLPELGQASDWVSEPFKQVNTCRGGEGNHGRQWLVQRVDVRVVERKQTSPTLRDLPRSDLFWI